MQLAYLRGWRVGRSAHQCKISNFSKLWWNSMGTFIKTRLQSMYQNIHPACHPCAWWWIVLDTTVSWRSWLAGHNQNQGATWPFCQINISAWFSFDTHHTQVISIQRCIPKLAPIRFRKNPSFHPTTTTDLGKPNPWDFFGSKDRYRLRVNLAGIRHNLTGPRLTKKRWQQHIGTSHRLHSNQEWFIYY